MVRKMRKGLEAVWRQVERRIPGMAGGAYTVGMMTALACQTVYGADIFDTAKSAMQQVYTDVAGLATVGAVVCAAVCLFLMNFSKSGKTVDESRGWLKRIIICWAALMTLGGYCDLHGEDHSSEFVYAVNGESRTRVVCLSGVCFTAG